jgi:hypothetical protein
MGAACVISRYVRAWSLRGPALERQMRELWNEFKKAREEFERDFFP